MEKYTEIQWARRKKFLIVCEKKMHSNAPLPHIVIIIVMLIVMIYQLIGRQKAKKSNLTKKERNAKRKRLRNSPLRII